MHALIGSELSRLRVEDLREARRSAAPPRWHATTRRALPRPAHR